MVRFWSFEIDFWVIFHRTEKDTGTQLPVNIYLFWIINVLNWLDLNFSGLLSKMFMKIWKKYMYLQYVWFLAWVQEGLFLESNTIMKLSWASVPVHTEIDNMYLQNLWHNGSIDYFWVQTVGHLNCFHFMTQNQFLNQCIVSDGRVVWTKKSLTPKEQNAVDCFFFTLYMTR